MRSPSRSAATARRTSGPSTTRPLDFAGDIALLAELLDLPPMVVVGHSMGTSVALQLAGDRPDLVRALVGVGTFARYGDKADLRAFRDTDVAALQDPVPDAIAREFQVSTLANPIDEAMLEVMVRESRKVPARIWRAAFDGLLRRPLLRRHPDHPGAGAAALGQRTTAMRCAPIRTCCAARCPTHACWCTSTWATRCTGSSRSVLRNDLADFVASLGATDSNQPTSLFA